MYSSVNYRYYILCDNRKFIPAGNRTDGAQGKSPANFHLLRLLRKVQDKKSRIRFFPAPGYFDAGKEHGYGSYFFLYSVVIDKAALQNNPAFFLCQFT